MRKFLLATGVILVVASLVALAYTDAQLRIALFGVPQSLRSSTSGVQFPLGSVSAAQTAAAGALAQQSAIEKVLYYLLGAAGLTLIILGSTLQPKAKAKEDVKDADDPSQPPPWENSEIPGVKSGDSSS